MLAVRCGGAARQCAYARSCGADSRVHARSQRARPAAVAGGGCGQGGCCRTAARRRQRGRVAGRPLGTAFTHGQAPRPALLAFSTPRQCTDAAGVTPADPGESPARLKSPATADHLHVVSGVSTCTVQGNEESASRGRAPMGRGLFRALGHASGRQVFIQGGWFAVRAHRRTCTSTRGAAHVLSASAARGPSSAVAPRQATMARLTPFEVGQIKAHAAHRRTARPVSCAGARVPCVPGRVPS